MKLDLSNEIDNGWGFGMFQLELSENVGLNHGDGIATFTRASMQLVKDYRGKLIEVPANRAAFQDRKLVTTVAEGAELGPELAAPTMSGADAENYIEKVSEGRYRFVGDGKTATFLNWSISQGRRYRIEVSNVVRVSGALKCSDVDNGDVFLGLIASGTYEYTFATSALRIFRNLFGEAIDITATFSVREVLQTFIPVTEADLLADGSTYETIDSDGNLLGPELSSGTLTINETYQITATETDTFYSGCAVGDTFQAESATSLDSNNKVKLILHSGCQLEGESTNKCTCYSVPTPQDAGSEESSGTLTKGKVYEITATETDHFYAGCAVGETFVATAETALDANNKVKELPQAEGTKSFHDGSDWIQNIPNMTLSGDTSATLEIVDDSTAIEAAGLDELCNEGLVYKLDNSGGSANATVEITGPSANTNAHSLLLYTRGDGTLQLDSTAGAEAFSETSYRKVLSENVTPADTIEKLTILVAATKTAYFILPQLEESAFSTSPILTAGSAATRAACLLSYPTAGNLPVNDFSIETEVVPLADGQVDKWLLSSYSDANNYTGIFINATQVILKKVIATVEYTATFTYSHDVAELIAVKATIDSVNGLKLSINGGTIVTDADTTDCVLGTAFQVGALNGGSRFGGNFRDIKIYNYAKPVSWLTE